MIIRSSGPRPTDSSDVEDMPSARPRGRAARPRSSRATIVFIALSTLILLIAGERVGGRYGLLAGFFASIAVAALVIFYARLRLARLFPSRCLEGRDAWGVRARLDNIGARLGVPTPEVFSFDWPTPAAYTIGAARWDSAIFLSRGLLESFSEAEVEAVLAHETLRLLRQDTARLTLAAAVSSGFLLVARLIDAPIGLLRFVIGWAPKPGLAATAPLGFVFQAPLDRPSRCFERDREAAAIVGDSNTLARVLWKLAQYSATRPIPVSPFEAALFMVNPLTQTSWFRYFVRQPKVEHRIKRLVGRFPL